MSIQITIAQASILIALTYSLLVFIKFQKVTIKKGKITAIASLIYDGLLAFGKRISSSTLQAILYTTIVFLVFSQIFARPFYWNQIAAFFIGGLLICLSSYTCILIIPKIISAISSDSKAPFQTILSWLYKASSCFSFFVIGLSLLGFTLCYLYLGPQTLIGYSLGILLASYYLRIGGGLFKSGTQICSNLGSQVDNSVPEFDARNPTTILDIVGDYIGKIVGYSSDILSSFMLSLMACSLFPSFLAQQHFITYATAQKLQTLTFAIIWISLITAFAALVFSHFRIKSKHTDNFLLEGLYISIVSSGTLLFFILKILDISIPPNNVWGAVHFDPFFAYFAGLIGAVLIGFSSEYLTSNRFSPAKETAEQAQFGTVVSMINAFKIGLRGNSIYLLYLIGIFVISFYFSGFLGITFASLGMLSVTPTLLTINMFSSLSSASLKAFQLTEEKNHIFKQLQKADHVGQTTDAIGNGFASGAALLSAFGLFFALFFTKSTPDTILNLDRLWIIGFLIGLLLPNLFSSVLIHKLHGLIHFTLDETFRQLKEIPFLKENKAKPDIIKAADENARFCMDSLILPIIIMAFPPILLGYIFPPALLLGLIIGAIFSALNLSYYWATMGDNSQNAKKYIHKGFLGGTSGPNYPHILTVNNIGNVFKEVLSPSFNIFIKSVVVLALLVLMFQIN
jgi:K(+)-stimulated pyrophosphate-energized sodium pump